MRVEWHEGLSVGNRIIDAQHKKLFDIVNRLALAISEPKSRRSLAGVAEELQRYAAVHFHHEEAKMREANFPDLVAHRIEHQLFEEKLKSLVGPLQSGSTFTASTTLRWLTDWIGDHITLVDHKYVDWLRDSAEASGESVPDPSDNSDAS